MTLKNKAALTAPSAAVLWSSSGALIKSVDWSGISIASSRCLLAAISLCLYTRRLPRPPRDLPSLSCALTYSILVIAFVLATKMTTAANAILLLYTAPVYVALLAPFFIKEPTRGRDWLFIIAAIGGIVLFFMDSLSLEGMRGNLLALGFLQQGLGYFLFSLAAPHLSALELIVIPSIEPILNPVLAALFIGEIPGAWSLAGGIIVLVTITSWSIIRAGGKKEQGAARRGRSGAAIKVRPAAKRTS